MVFSQQIREATAQHHRAVESGPFIARFVRGQITLPEFQAMQAKLYFVYRAMEGEITRHKDHPLVRPFTSPVLLREGSLEQDLAFLFGPDWADSLEPTPAVSAYVERIRSVGDHEPEVLLGHIYTRYLGDLSGGQVLARVVRKALSLEGSIGTRFYEFDDIEDIQAFKEEFRANMDGLPLVRDQAERIIEESKYVFDLNQALFNEIG